MKKKKRNKTFNNPVAKHLHKFNKPIVERDKTKYNRSTEKHKVKQNEEI